MKKYTLWLVALSSISTCIIGIWLGAVLEMSRTYTNCSKYGETFLYSSLFKKTIVIECLPRSARPPQYRKSKPTRKES